MTILEPRFILSRNISAGENTAIEAYYDPDLNIGRGYFRVDRSLTELLEEKDENQTLMDVASQSEPELEIRYQFPVETLEEDFEYLRELTRSKASQPGWEHNEDEQPGVVSFRTEILESTGSEEYIGRWSSYDEPKGIIDIFSQHQRMAYQAIMEERNSKE